MEISEEHSLSDFQEGQFSDRFPLSLNGDSNEKNSCEREITLGKSLTPEKLEDDATRNLTAHPNEYATISPLENNPPNCLTNECSEKFLN